MSQRGERQQMLGFGKRVTVLAVTVALAAALAGGPASGVEDGLLGVRIGTSYRELNERFGPPDGILFPSGSGLIFQTVAAQVAQAGLPDFGGQPTSQTPVWVLPIQTLGLGGMQSQWVYDLRDSRGVSLGIVLDGEGADAVVTDVVVAGFPKYLKGKGVPVRTQKGVTLQSTFTDVLKKYGYPPLIEIYAPVGARAAGRPAAGGGLRAGARTGAMRAGGARGAGRGGGRAQRGGRGRGGGRGMRGGRWGAAPLEDMMTGDKAPLRVVLTGAPGRRGGGRMRGMGRSARAGGARGGRAFGGGARRTLPPLGAARAAAEPGEELTASAVVEHQQISFSRDCIMVYEGISFTLHDMKVFRIHVSE